MSNIKIGDIVEGQITGVTKYGIFVSLEDNYVGMVHISEVSTKFVSNLEQKYNVGDLVKVKVLSIDEDKLQVKLSIKKMKTVVKRKPGIEEKGGGFEPLRENLNAWVDETLKKIEKKSYLSWHKIQ